MWTDQSDIFADRLGRKITLRKVVVARDGRMIEHPVEFVHEPGDLPGVLVRDEDKTKERRRSHA